MIHTLVLDVCQQRRVQPAGRSYCHLVVAVSAYRRIADVRTSTTAVRGSPQVADRGPLLNQARLPPIALGEAGERWHAAARAHARCCPARWTGSAARSPKACTAPRRRWLSRCSAAAGRRAARHRAGLGRQLAALVGVAEPADPCRRLHRLTRAGHDCLTRRRRASRERTPPNQARLMASA